MRILSWLWGGFAVDNPTLNRFFSLHYLLPFVIFALVFLHLWALHVGKSNNPVGIDVKDPGDTIPFHPYYTAKDSFGLGVMLIVYAAFVFFAPDFFGEPDNYIEANALVTPTQIVPEWYLLPYYAILRAFTDDFIVYQVISLGGFLLTAKLAGVIAMFGSILLLLILPWLDTSPVRSARFPAALQSCSFGIFVVDSILLGYIGAKPAHEPFTWIGQIATTYYFFHFLILLPVLGKLERPLAVPESISAAVTKSSA